MRSRGIRIKADIALAAVLLTAAAGAYFIALPERETGAYAVVYENGVETARYSLDSDITVSIISRDGGENILSIKEGFADIESADCPDRTCVSMRRIRYRGESIICLPNKIAVKIEGGIEPDIDIPVG